MGNMVGTAAGNKLAKCDCRKLFLSWKFLNTSTKIFKKKEYPLHGNPVECSEGRNALCYKTELFAGTAVNSPQPPKSEVSIPDLVTERQLCCNDSFLVLFFFKWCLL